jgi:hypothetical protein
MLNFKLNNAMKKVMLTAAALLITFMSVDAILLKVETNKQIIARAQTQTQQLSTNTAE